MLPGPPWFRIPRLLALPLALLSSLVGCLSPQARVERNLLAQLPPAVHTRDLQLHYLVRSPDVLEVEVAGRPDCSGLRPVSIDGRIAVTPSVHLPVDGRPTPWIARDLAHRLHVPSQNVHVQVHEYQSQHLYLFGEVGLRNQVVPYRGPETIVDLLQRIGTTPDAALGDIRIIRAHVADGKPPEMFNVNLPAILHKRDLQTNIRLEPFDRIHVGRSRAGQITAHVPPWVKLCCGRRVRDEKPAAATPPEKANLAVNDRRLGPILP